MVDEKAHEWWDDGRKMRYPFHVRTSNKIKPPEVTSYVKGDFASVVLEKGVRTWGFETAADRQLFLDRNKDLVIP